MWQPSALLSGALAWVVFAACAGAPNGSAGGGPRLEGVIVFVHPGPTSTRLTIAAGPAAAESRPEGRSVLHVWPRTEILVQRADGTVERGRAADLVVGARIQAEITGVERRSLPPQYDAVRVRVIARS